MKIVGVPLQWGLCYVLLVILHLSFARFGDYDYWRRQRKINCDRKCPARELLCNGVRNCIDGSDEDDCIKCRGPNTFHCDNNRCISLYLRCNGDDNCWDGSDERDCTDWVRPWDANTYEVPTKIKHIDAANFVTVNYSAQISTMDDFNLEIYAYKSIRPDKPLDARTVLYDSMRKVVFYIHGFREDNLEDGVAMKDALAEGTDDVDCILVVDWRAGSMFNHGWIPEHWPGHIADDYTTVVYSNVPVVADVVASFVNKYIPLITKVHFIGFSLGGQISGIAARRLQDLNIRTVDRISALDPAGPIFEYSVGLVHVDPTNTLRVTDAKFVDVIHASSVLGMVKSAGHLDIDIDDSDCITPTCLHNKAIQVYKSSIDKCSQITCPSGKLIVNGACEVSSPTELGSLGYLADLYTGRGRHTIRYWYYYLGMYEHKISTDTCNSFMSVFLKAKDRICRKPPTSTSDCRSRPYLTECEEDCRGPIAKTVCSVAGLTLQNANGKQPQLQIEFGKNVKSVASWIGDKCVQPMSCYGENGERLDYFIAYKEPNSYNYFYLYRSANGIVGMVPGQYSIADHKSVLGRTLLPIYEQVRDTLFVVWNDDKPYGSKGLSVKSPNNLTNEGDVHTEDSDAFGHTKGILAYSTMGGFLLSHSIPRFPPDPDNVGKPYEYPESGRKFAQMAACVTSEFNGHDMLEELNVLVMMMIKFRPQIYGSNVPIYWPLELRDKFTVLVHPPTQNLGAPIWATLTYGKAKAKIHSFGRSRNNLYEDCFQKLARSYNTPIFAQTWLDRQNPLSSNCQRPLTVENVKAVQIYNGVSWLQTNDHSKWIVAKVVKGQWVSTVLCVGDLNRAISTITRGGMFICLEDIRLLELFYGNVQITDYDVCPAVGA